MTRRSSSVKRARLLEQTRRQTDLPDVMNQAGTECAFCCSLASRPIRCAMSRE